MLADIGYMKCSKITKNSDAPFKGSYLLLTDGGSHSNALLTCISYLLTNLAIKLYSFAEVYAVGCNFFVVHFLVQALLLALHILRYLFQHLQSLPFIILIFSPLDHICLVLFKCVVQAKRSVT